jgi:hypothetical protein
MVMAPDGPFASPLIQRIQFGVSRPLRKGNRFGLKFISVDKLNK